VSAGTRITPAFTQEQPMPSVVRTLHRARRSFGAAAALTLLATASLAAQAKAPSPDPRIGLKAGRYDAGEAAWNMRLVSTTKSPPRFEDGVNSDLAFTGKYAIQGNFNGFVVWDISNPAKPVITTELLLSRRHRVTSRSTSTCSSSRARGWKGVSTAPRAACRPR
jgi:hypothetical protein